MTSHAAPGDARSRDPAGTPGPAATALVLVDYQARLLPAIHRGDAVLADAVFLARAARELGIPVIATEQNPAGLGPNVDAVKRLCERTVVKTHFDACGDGLLDALARDTSGPARVVVAGCESHVCLMQTALGLRRAGHPVAVVADACGSRRPQDHAVAMQRLAAAGAEIVGAEMQVFEWLGDCLHPRFKAVLALVKERPVASA